MQPQSYSNHIRYYAPHHFVFYPLLLLLLLACLFMGWHDPAQRTLWLGFGVLLVLLGWLSFMMRQHYALNNQNRIVRLEMRFRYFTLTGQRLEPMEHRLSFGQIAALRFAGDEELPALIGRTLAEGLSPGAIKRAIQHWEPDYMRV
ncbi:DUF6526 family protein [Taibaiella koreensis]|uniref:DUF6526 family protein n=1 Tax=Taibaiella koreensis TaxID=1268548 RepID=UPI000E59A47D|nr:DUF6526 family protein [Taibaiella koreensis]